RSGPLFVPSPTAASRRRAGRGSVRLRPRPNEDRDMDATTERFEANRSRLRGIAYRMLGSLAEAEDAVQETWLRYRRGRDIDDPDAWLTTAVGRVCLNLLRARRTRREDPLDAPT